MSKWSVRSTCHSKSSYWTLLRPKYCAASGRGTARGASTATATRSEPRGRVRSRVGVMVHCLDGMKSGAWRGASPSAAHGGNDRPQALATSTGPPTVAGSSPPPRNCAPRGPGYLRGSRRQPTARLLARTLPKPARSPEPVHHEVRMRRLHEILRPRLLLLSAGVVIAAAGCGGSEGGIDAPTRSGVIEVEVPAGEGSG